MNMQTIKVRLLHENIDHEILEIEYDADRVKNDYNGSLTEYIQNEEAMPVEWQYASGFKVIQQDEEPYTEQGCEENRLGHHYSRRMAWKTPDGEFLTLTSSVYLEGRVLNKKGETVEEMATDEHNLLPFYHAVIDMDNFEDDQLFLEVWESGTDEWIWHTDLDDVGGTEVQSTYEPIESIGYLWPNSFEQGYENIKRYISEEDYFEHYYPENA